MELCGYRVFREFIRNICYYSATQRESDPEEGADQDPAAVFGANQSPLPLTRTSVFRSKFNGLQSIQDEMLTAEEARGGLREALNEIKQKDCVCCHGPLKEIVPMACFCPKCKAVGTRLRSAFANHSYRLILDCLSSLVALASHVESFPYHEMEALNTPVLLHACIIHPQNDSILDLALRALSLISVHQEYASRCDELMLRRLLELAGQPGNAPRQRDALLVISNVIRTNEQIRHVCIANSVPELLVALTEAECEVAEAAIACLAGLSLCEALDSSHIVSFVGVLVSNLGRHPCACFCALRLVATGHLEEVSQLIDFSLKEFLSDSAGKDVKESCLEFLTCTSAKAVNESFSWNMLEPLCHACSRSIVFDFIDSVFLHDPCEIPKAKNHHCFDLLFSFLVNGDFTERKKAFKCLLHSMERDRGILDVAITSGIIGHLAELISVPDDEVISLCLEMLVLIIQSEVGIDEVLDSGIETYLNDLLGSEEHSEPAQMIIDALFSKP